MRSKPNTSTTTPTGENVNPIQLRFESELKALDGRQPDFATQVMLLAKGFEARMKHFGELKLKLLAAHADDDNFEGTLLSKLIDTCAKHIADQPGVAGIYDKATKF